jgi:hypothetical protein
MMSVFGAFLLLGSSRSARAEDVYTAPDGKLTFSFPRRWTAENIGDKVRITAPDGTRFFLLKDTISAVPGESPAANPELRPRAAELVRPILKDALFASAQPLTLDHGSGAAFRFQSPSKSDAVPLTTVYLAFLGKHSIVVLPEKAGQASQSIGLATIFQSIAFTDELPKAPPQRVPQRPASDGGATIVSGPGTISFATQIAPIFREKCEVCHRSSAPLGGFSVTTYAELLKGGRGGSVIMTGRPDASTLMDYLTGRRTLMPKGGPPLPSDQIALIRQWIAEGARQQVGGAVASSGNTSPLSRPAGIGTAGERPYRMRPGQGTGGMLANRPNRLAAGPAASAGPQLLEGYSGHLVLNDLSFSLRLHLDKSASAIWTLSPGREVRYSGTFVGQDGSYVVTLTQSGGATIDQGKTLTIEMRPRGSQETGIYGLDGARPRREIAELELSETRTSDKPSRPGGGVRAGGAQRPMRGRRGR